MENPNEYNDDEFARYSVELDSALVALWEAGASVDDIRSVVENAFQNATDQKWTVSVYEGG